MEPALLLATRILASGHPHLTAITDLRTRQLIGTSQDPRDEDDDENPPRTSFLYKYVPMSRIDLDKCHENIRNLHRMGYNWPANVRRVLDKQLYLDIGSAYWSPMGRSDIENAIYGFTYRESKGPQSSIHISIAAEMIWPLLVPGISASEKLASSFMLATTLLHEMAV